MRITTLNISSNIIKYVTTNGSGKVKHGSVSPEGLINNGLILQPDAIASQIKSMFTTNSLPKDRVICSINGLPFSYRLFTLPKMETAAFNEAILREIRKEMPISPEEMYLLWQAYPAGKNEWKVLVAGITRQPIDNLIKTLLAAGIKPYYLDLQHLSLARLTNENDAIIVECEKDYSNIVMLVEGVPQALHIIPSMGPEAALQDEVRQISSKLTKLVNFYNSNHPKNPIKDTAKVLLTGELVNDIKVVELIRQEVTYSVEVLTPVDNVKSGLPLHDYAVNAGSMLMNVISEKEAGIEKAPYRSINLGRIAKELQGGNIGGKLNIKMLVSIAVFAGIAALAFAFLSQNQVQTDISQVQAELAKANSEFSQVQGTIDNAQAIKDNISGIEAQIENIDTDYVAITESRDYVSDIAAITRSIPEGIIFTSLEISSDQISVFGKTDMASPVVRFARNLESMGGFSKADINWIDYSSGVGGPGLAFMIIINR
jgi:Tfp pilus assembly PilM family ATPase/Tfp pilus assembly protein PilN